MKEYNINNYNRYKKDVKSSQPEGKFWDEYTRDELIIKFMPLVENIARKFSPSLIVAVDLIIGTGSVAISSSDTVT
jgi:DNA-directed RNA polymerase specialized sigma subunit